MKKSKLKLPDKSLRGIFWITLSALFFGSYGVWSKLMAESFGDFSQGWIRGLLIVLVLIPIGIYKKSFKKVDRKDIVWFSLVSIGALNQAPYFFAFGKLTIGTATLLFYASLLVGGYIVGKIVFKEIMTAPKIIALLLSIVGMYIIFEFSISRELMFGAAMAVLAGLMGGVEVTSTKKVSNNYSNIQILTILFIVMFLGNLPPALILKESIPSISQSTAWLAQLGYTGAMLAAMYTVVKGFQYLEASVGSILGLTEIIFAAIFGVILFSESITLSLIIGGIIILIAAAIPQLFPSKIED